MSTEPIVCRFCSSTNCEHGDDCRDCGCPKCGMPGARFTETDGNVRGFCGDCEWEAVPGAYKAWKARQPLRQHLPPNIAVRVLPAGLPVLVRDLSFESNRPVIDPARLFFRETKPTLAALGGEPGQFDSWGPFALEHRIFYLWQGDGSLAVYAYLFDGSHAAGRAYGCLYVGCVRPQDWTLGGVE